MSTAGVSASRTAARHAKGCRHCGAPLTDQRTRESGFCCAGCSYVHRLVHEHGLDGYYRIKDEVTAPVDGVVFQPRDFEWLASLQTATENAAAPGTPNLDLSVQGISCAGCVWLIERLFLQQPGARDIVVNAQLGQLEMRWTAGAFDAAAFAQKLHAFNYRLGPPNSDETDLESRRLIRRIGLCAAFAMNVMLFTLPVYFGMESTFAYARLFGTLSLIFGTLSLFAGGGYFIQRAWQGLRVGMLHIDLPISIGIVGAYLGSLYGWVAGEESYIYFDFVSGFVVLMLVGRWAQIVAVERNRRRLLAQQPRPQDLRVCRDGAAPVSAPPESLQPGDDYLIRSGQIIPVESTLAEAKASLSLASINGESEPRLFSSGQRVPAGAINLGRGDIHLTARQAWADSLLAELTRLNPQSAYRQPLLERIITGYLIGILGIAALAGLGWGLATGDLLRTGAIVTAILVVSCPCAIGLAFPLADEISSVALRRRGVFVRSAELWTKLGRVRKLVFDKTGTLTLETPPLRNPETLAVLTPESRDALFTLVQGNSHPVSQSLLEALLADGPPPQQISGHVTESIGAGVELGPWSLGRAGWKNDIPVCPATVFAYEGQTLAVFEFSDEIRPDTHDEVQRLRASGLQVYILSGDAPEKVHTMTTSLGLPAEHGLGSLSPQDKAAWFKTHDDRDTLMLGDGANDSLAFDAAFCRGTPAIHRGLLESKADFYYLGRGIGGIRALLAVNAVRHRTHIRILIFSVVYNLLAVGFAAAGMINPLIAAILMPANSLLTLALVSTSMRRAYTVKDTKSPFPVKKGAKVVVGPGFEPGKA